MISCNCVVQAGQISAETEASLRANLNAFSERSFGEAVDITWIAIPENSGFTENKPSTASVISMRANTPVPQAKREALLRDLCAIWTSGTGCTLNEVVGVISDPLAQ